MRLLAVAAGAAVLVSVCAVAAPGDILQTLGTNSTEAHESILTSFTSGTISLIGESSVFKTAPPETRVMLVRGVIAAARVYTVTEDFSKRYAAFRDRHRPQREYTAQTSDEAIAESERLLEASITEMLQAAANATPDERRRLEERIAEMRHQMKEMAEDPAQKAMRDRMVPQMARAYAAEHRLKLAEFEKLYPADPRQLIARRLRAFLALSATVDFDARLEVKNRKARFVDPALEGKPREWKLLFRAGKPAVDAAREAAEEWLEAIGS